MNIPAFHLNARSGSEKERIWRIADELAARKGALPSGKEVVEIYAGEGGNPGTGYTQFSHWKREAEKALASENPSSKPSVAGSVEHRAMSVSEDGRFVIPMDMRAAMMLEADGRVTVSVDRGVMTIISPLAAVKRLQALTRGLVPSGTLVSEELIAERRKEAARE